MNLLKYDYEAMDLPNVFMTYRKGSEERLPAKISPKLNELVEAVARKYPKWKLVADSYFNHDSHYHIRRMAIYEGEERLGTIGENYVRCSTVFEMSNDRIKAERIRGQSTCTKDLNKAMKVIAKMFGAKTLYEVLSDGCDDISERLNRVHYSNDSSRSYAAHPLFAVMQAHILDNLAQYREILIGSGVSEGEIQKLVDAQDKAERSGEMKECFERNHGAVVQIRGADYIVCKTADPYKTMRKFTSDTLPSELKSVIGMLKLLDVDALIPSKGFKYSDSQFFVVVEDAVWMQ